MSYDRAGYQFGTGITVSRSWESFEEGHAMTRAGVWSTACVLSLLAIATGRAWAISYGDVWYAEEGGQVVLISSSGTILAQTTGLGDPKAITADPSDGTLWVAGGNSRIYHVALDGTYSVLVDLSADPMGAAPTLDSIALAPGATGGGVYVKSDRYGDWGLYRVLPSGAIPWAVNPGRASGMHALSLDLLSGNPVLCNYGDGSIGVHSYQDGQRLGGCAMSTGRLAQKIDVYQHDGSWWVEDTASPAKIKHLPAGGGGGLPTDYYLVSKALQEICINQLDGTIWLIIGADTAAEVIHVTATGSPASELARFGLATISDPKDLDIDYASGNIWVADRKNRQVVKYATDGTELGRYTSPRGKYLRAVAVYNAPLDMSGAITTNRTYPDRTPLATGTHPRLFLTASDLAAIRTRVLTAPWSTWYSEIKASADAALTGTIQPFGSADYTVLAARALNAHYLAFVGLVENNVAYLNKARQSLTWKRWQNVQLAYGAEMNASDIGMHVALAYDMAYSALTDPDKTGLEKEMEIMPQAGYSRLGAGGWGWGSNVGTKTGAGMGLVGLAIGTSTATWAQNYFNMYVSTVEDGLNHAFDSSGFYGDSQGYLATGWYNTLHTLLAQRKTGGTDYYADPRLLKWHAVLAQTASPLGTIVQFEDASLTGGYMMMTTALPLAAALAPSSYADAKAWMKFGYECTVAHHPYRGGYYTTTTYDPDMVICFVSEAAWGGITAAPPPNSFLATAYPAGGYDSFLVRSGMDPADDVQMALNARRWCGWPTSSHEHMDGGALEMFAYGTRLLVTPGYSDSGGAIADWQDATLAASTLIADRNGNGTFDMIEDRQDGGYGGSGNGAAERAVADQIGLFCGTYDYWYANNPTFTRNILFVGKSAGRAPYYVAIDDVDTTVPSRILALTWHSRGSLTVAGQQGEWVTDSEVGGDPVTLDINVVKPEGLTVSTASGYYYPFFASSYTPWQETVPYVIAQASGASSYRFLSVLYPRKSGQALPPIAAVSGQNACTVGGDDLFFTQDEPYGTISVADVSTDAELGFVRKHSAADLDGFIAKRATSLNYAGAGFTASQAVTFSLLDMAGAVETYAAGTSLTVNDPEISSAATLELDGAPAAASASAGSITFSVAAAGHHSVRIVLPLVGDINGDGHVDAADVLMLAGSFGKHVGDPGCDPRCDLNGDNCVDVSDLLILARNWGT
jgi:hypothetical protein